MAKLLNASMVESGLGSDVRSKKAAGRLSAVAHKAVMVVYK